jgi:MFS family permease
VFATGWLVLLVGSVVAGAAGEIWVELTGRALQGAGTALIAPSALTLLMMLFVASRRSWAKPLPCTARRHRPVARQVSSSAA